MDWNAVIDAMVEQARRDRNSAADAVAVGRDPQGAMVLLISSSIMSRLAICLTQGVAVVDPNAEVPRKKKTSTGARQPGKRARPMSPELANV